MADKASETGGMEFDVADMDARDRYFLLTGAVVPRPIAWVSSLDEQGTRNLAPFSYFNVCSTSPAIVHFTATGPKDSRANVLWTREFVVNIVSSQVAEAMRISSAGFPRDADEFTLAGVTAEPSACVQPPRVAEASVALECRLRQVLEIGAGTMMFGDVVQVRVDPKVWRNGRIDHAAMRPLGRLSGVTYALVERPYRLDLPDWVKEQVGDYEVPGRTARGDERV